MNNSIDKTGADKDRRVFMKSTMAGRAGFAGKQNLPEIERSMRSAG